MGKPYICHKGGVALTECEEGCKCVKGIKAGDCITVDDSNPYYPVISTDACNSVYSIVAGDNVRIDSTDPQNPIVHADVGVKEIVAGPNVTVDNTDPERPIVSSVGGSSGSSTAGRTLVVSPDGVGYGISDGDFSYHVIDPTSEEDMPGPVTLALSRVNDMVTFQFNGNLPLISTLDRRLVKLEIIISVPSTLHFKTIDSIVMVEGNIARLSGNVSSLNSNTLRVELHASGYGTPTTVFDDTMNVLLFLRSRQWWACPFTLMGVATEKMPSTLYPLLPNSDTEYVSGAIPTINVTWDQRLD